MSASPGGATLFAGACTFGGNPRPFAAPTRREKPTSGSEVGNNRVKAERPGPRV
jgi:hypothetical protein